jgi:hypothetical protein
MPTSRALAVFDTAGRFHLQMEAFVIQGIEWASFLVPDPFWR